MADDTSETPAPSRKPKTDDPDHTHDYKPIVNLAAKQIRTLVNSRCRCGAEHWDPSVGLTNYTPAAAAE